MAQTPYPNFDDFDNEITGSAEVDDPKLNRVFDYKQLDQFPDNKTLDNAMSDVRGMFNGENYSEVMQMLSDKYGATEINAATVEFLYSQAALTSILNEINKKGK